MCETCKALADSLENTRLEVEGAIAIVTMDRPKALNALSDKTLNELDRIFTYLAGAEEILGIILTGEGKGFVAGADISQMQPYGPSEGRAYADRAQTLFNKIEGIEKPVIAAVNGYALGGGCELAMSCDIRIASEKAVFGQPEANLGVIPCFGGTQRLPRLVGTGIAKELIYTGRQVKAAEAKEIGLVNQVVPADALLDAAKDMMNAITGKAPIAIRYSKVAINRGMDVDLRAGLELEKDLAALTFGTEDKQEGMDAFLAKRPAVFKNR
ncbi:MAG: enoyl-CoA hydratase/isomerase family protein [Flavonifractor sp.]|jgi:enoyl-CoA hydratase|nr:enoyl-CoA hydratase/isomerase family protein [Flavonifractor sp.]MCI9473334.1 enoyl-CoA hydratase/isomerase family protein [Flavonifractor sp.]